jgi:hypothetical protein
MAVSLGLLGFWVGQFGLAGVSDEQLGGFAGQLEQAGYGAMGLGFTEQDLASGGSGRLVDATIAWGDPAAVAARITEHHQAGASHVAVQVLGTGNPLPIAELREISAALSG